MTTKKPGPLDELAAQHAELEQQLWQNVKQQLAGDTGAKDIHTLLAKLAPVPPDIDLAAWEPEKFAKMHYSAQNGQLTDRPDDSVMHLTDEQRQKLCEDIAQLPRGITDAQIAGFMLEVCGREHPELLNELKDFLDDNL